MDLLIAPNTVSLAQADRAPTTGTPGYATDGNDNLGIPPTSDSAYQANALQHELVTVIRAAGLVPDPNNWEQVIAAVRLLFRPFGNDFAFSNCRQYLTPGTGSFLVPAGVTRIRFRLVSGGAAGGGCVNGSFSGGGGGAGGYAEGYLDVVPGSSFPFVVGAGGTGTAGDGNSGGTSSIGTAVSITGGVRGQGNPSNPIGGGGGTPAIAAGFLNIFGSQGADGGPGQIGPSIYAGYGAGSAFGSGGTPGGGGVGLPGRGYGAGGGGAYGTTGSGGNGAAGCLVLEY